MNQGTEKKTVLYEEHLKRGAKMTPYGGYLMPLQYEGIIAEHRAVREEVGVFDVSHMGEFMIKGSGAAAFLDELLTNPVSDLAVGRVRYSPMCYETGGTVDDLVVYAMDDGYLLVVNAANLQKDAEWIKSRLPKEGVSFEDISEETSLLAVQGPKSKDVMNSIGEGLPTRFFSYKHMELLGHEVLVSRTGYTGEYGYEIYGSHAAIRELWDVLMSKDVKPCGLGARDTLRLEAGLPLYGNELSEEIRPDEAGLSFAIKLDRGGFVGREVLLEPSEREHVRLKVDGRGLVRPGQELFAGDEKIGVITSGTQAPTLGYGIGMALISKERPDAPWHVEARGRKLPVIQVQENFLDHR